MEIQNEIGKSVILAGTLIKKFEEGGLSRQLLEQLSNSKEALFKMIEAGTKELGIEVFFSVFFGEPLATLTLNVPKDYSHQNCFEDSMYFRERGMLKAQRVDDVFKDETFPMVSHTLCPGHAYEVSLFPVKNSIPYRVALEFALFKNSLLTGSQGLMATLRYLKDELPTDVHIESIDYEENRIDDKRSFSIFIRKGDKYVSFNFRINANDPSHHSLYHFSVVPVFKLIS